ncbi:hypothetical protein [Nocardia miyunensis]|uniref:hypothetical protein n=1 Tax=Nocardia miyunensis TaxID=282684 RepID=UPI00082E2A6F|nr:hypothetical protein [Nocardia miyunensis]
MNPEPLEQDSLDDEWYETLLEMFCASARYAPDLTSQDVVGHAADDLIDRISYEPTVAEFHPAFVRAVAAETLPPGALAAAEIHSEATILSFLGRLLEELERRLPWPEPTLVPVDAEEWPSLGSGLPIAWLELPLPLVEQAVRASFDPDSSDPEDAGMPLLVLRLRSRQLVAVLGEQSSEPSRFLVLLPDAEGQQDAAEVIEYLIDHTNLPLRTEGIEQSMTTLSGL